MVIEFTDNDGEKTRMSETTLDHKDQGGRKIRFRDSGLYKAPLKYSGETRSHRTNYGRVEDRGESGEIVHPVEDPAELDRIFHLEAQFHDQNRDWANDIEGYENNGGALFDVAIVDLFDFVTAIEGLEPADVNVGPPLLRTLYIMEARGLTDGEDRSTLEGVELSHYRDYLENEYSETPSQFRIHDVQEQLKRENVAGAVSSLTSDQWHRLERASKRALYAAFRNGIVPPDTAGEKYNFSKSGYTIDESNIGRPSKREDLRTWVQDLALETIESLTFGRKNHDRSIFDFLGLWAASAKFKTAVGTAATVADWNYDRAEITAPSVPSRYIRERVASNRAKDQSSRKREEAWDRPSIEEQFDAVHRKTLAKAREWEFFDGPQSLAIDNVKIDWTKQSLPDTVSVPPDPTNDVSEQWMFTVVSVVNTGSRFTIGAKLLNDKSDYPEIARDLMEKAREHFSIDSVYADAEMVSGDLIEYIRDVAGSDWILKCPKREGDIENLPVLTPDLRAGYVENVPYNISNGPNPNLLAFPHPSNLDNPVNHQNKWKTPIEFKYPVINQDDATDLIKGEERSTQQTSFDIDHAESNQETGNEENANKKVNLKKPVENEEEKALLSYEQDINHLPSLSVTNYKGNHETYLTDQKVPDIKPADIFLEYKRRWSIEATMDQLKNHFLPKTESRHPEVRVYYLNLAILFQNWYTLINRAPSPQFQLRLDPAPEEVLTAIQDLAFSEQAVCE